MTFYVFLSCFTRFLEHCSTVYRYIIETSDTTYSMHCDI